jgi:hypothetical protein
MVPQSAVALESDQIWECLLVKYFPLGFLTDVITLALLALTEAVPVDDLVVRGAGRPSARSIGD